MNFVEFSYSKDTLDYKKSYTPGYLEIRSNNVITSKKIAMMQGM